MVSNQLCAKYSQEYAQLCRTNEIGTVTSQNDSSKKSDLCPSLFPSTGFNLPTSPKPESRSKMGFDNFMPPDLPDEKPQASLSIDPCGSEEVDFEDLNRRLEILKKTTKFLGLGLINCLGIRALQHKC
ncbi:IST1 homolog isoform X2 [Prionailurus viverrinus]|uniref:IST1 homolog isoform X2 n=1 Tax=Prionailurus viverrinus TaxID=61388 RepID=UPI001FF530B7|nr:IST1 homolog isoform X2 [Prionailurus viverrinus]